MLGSSAGGSSAGGDSAWRLAFTVNYSSLYSTPTARSLDADTSGNLYLAINSQNSSNYSRHNIIKVSPDGSALFNSTKSHTSTDFEEIYSIAVDRSNGIVYTTASELSQTSANEGSIIKYDTALAAQAAKYNATPSQALLTRGRMGVSPGGTVVVASYTTDATSRFYLSRIDSSLSLLSQRRVEYGTEPWAADDVKFLSDSKIITFGAFGASGSVYPTLMCFDSGGTTLQWKVQQFQDMDAGRKVAVDDSDNVYTVTASSGVIYVRKYNSSGTRQWAKTISASSAFITGAEWVNGYLVIVGDTTKYTGTKPFVLGIDSSGSLAWNNYINVAQSAFGLCKASASSFGLATKNSNTIRLYKLPASGGLASGSSPISYTAGTLTASNQTSPTENNQTYTITTPTSSLTTYTTRAWTSQSPTYTLTQA